MLLFGLSCLCLKEGQIWPVFPLFALDVPMRETSIFLVIVAGPFLHKHYKRGIVAITLFTMSAYWVAIRFIISKVFYLNTSETGSRLTINLKNLALPLHWPQMASALGFLLVPIFLGREYLPGVMQKFLLLMIPCLLVTAWFGMWIESRIFLEWSVPVAYLATVEIANLYSPVGQIIDGTS
jgi:hypothetical protein